MNKVVMNLIEQNLNITIAGVLRNPFQRLKVVLVWALLLSLVWNPAMTVIAREKVSRLRAALPVSKATRATAMQSGSTIIWGPQDVVRQPINTTYTANFSLPAGALAPYTMTVSNGAPDGTRKVTSACVRINGTAVLSPTCNHTLNPSPQVRTVSLLADNTITVTLVGPSLSYITITITGSAASLAASPTSATQGQSLAVTMTGSGSNWAAGQTVANFGGEVTVNSLTVNSATSATAQITVSPTAALGPRTITMTTGSEIINAVDAFTVNAASPPGAASATVSTLAGTAGTPGFIDGTGAAARFRQLAGLAAAPNEVVYVADAGNHAIRRVDAAGAVTTTAGDGLPGFIDAQGTSAQFNNPQGVAIDAQGNLYVADTGNHSIRRIDTSGTVTTLAGDGTSGFVNGNGAAARFNAPRGIAVDTLGRIYVADTGNHAVRRIDSLGNVTTIAGDGTAGSSNAAPVRFNGLAGIAADGTEIYLYIADGNNHRIRRLDNNNTVITLAGLDRGFKDGTAAESRFADPTGIAVDGAGHVIVADSSNSLIRQIDPVRAINGESAAVFTIAGTGARGAANGAGNAASFNKPAGAAVLASGAVIVADTANQTLRKVLLPPTIASISPAQGAAGSSVTITGTRFDGRGTTFNTVQFTAAGGGAVAATINSATRTQLVVTVPAAAATGSVTVQTAGGTSNAIGFTVPVTAPPSIADFNPKTGPVGTLVTITGSNLKIGAADPAVTFAGSGSTRLPAFIAFSSPSEVRATVPNAAVTGVIQLTTSAGTATTAQTFTVAGTQDFALTLAPSTTTVVQGSTATYTVSATSPQTNFSQLVNLSVTGLPSGAVGSFNPAQITAGATATLTVKLTPSVSVSSHSFTVQGVTTIDGSNATRTTSGSFTVMAAGSTTLAGRVLSTENVPIPNCTVSAPAQSGSDVTATTDGAGNFMLIGLQSGPSRPIFIQPPAGSVYPAIKEPADVAANQSNTVPYTFYLPAIDPLNTPINPNGATDVTSARVPGLKMTIPQGVRLRVLGSNADVTHVSITPVPVDRTPAPLPANTSASMVYTSQPGNSCVLNASNQCITDNSGPKIPVIYPNLGGANPGTSVPLWAFDHNTVSWYQYGTGTVSADGRSIVPDAGVGLRDFSWHYASTPSGNGGNPSDPTSCPTSVGSTPVDYATGFKIERMTDISFGGARGGLELTRTYTSHQAIFYTGNGFADSNVFRFGVGTRDNFDVRLIGSFAANGSGYLVLPEQTPFSLVGIQTFNGGRLFSYNATLSASGVATFTNSTTSGMLGDTIRRIDATTLEYRSTSGFILRFEPNFNPGNLVVENYYRLKSVTDRNGNTHTLTYSGSNLTQVTDPVGRTLTFSYTSPNCAKCVSQVVAGKAGDPLQRITNYTYDTGRRLIKVIDQLGKEHQYAYSGNNLSRVTDRRGNNVKTLTYGPEGRVSSQTFADGGTVRYNYTLSGDVITGITIIDQLGRTISKRFNAAGYVIEEVDALGQVSKIDREIGTNLAKNTTGPCGCPETTKIYNAYGMVTSVKDRLNQTESWQYRTFANPQDYDPVLNQVTQYTDKRGNVTGYGYDTVAPNTLTPRGNLKTVTDARSKVTTYDYDYARGGVMVKVTDPLNNKRDFDYDGNGFLNSEIVKRNSDQAVIYQMTSEFDIVGNQKRMTDGEGRITLMNYDDLDRMISSIDPANATTTYGYDENGNNTGITDALNRQWTFTYDKKDRPETAKDPLNRVSRMQYDTKDQFITSISPSGRTTRFNYDERGQQTSIIDGIGGVATFGYDNRGNMISLKDQRGNTTTFAHDELFRPIRQRDPLGRLTSFEYDPMNNLKAKVDRLGRRIDIVYDSLNRLQQVTYVDAIVIYGYDDAYRFTSVSDATGAISWGYDEAHRVKTETTSQGVIQYDYNKASQRKTMIALDRPTVIYGYDTAGRLQAITQGNETFTYGYDAISRRQSLLRPNNVTTNYEYDEVNRIKRLTHINTLGVVLERFEYEFNLDDEVKSIITLASAPLVPVSKIAAAADAANRVLGFSNVTYGFDYEGQMISKTDGAGMTGYQWDARGRLAQVNLPNGQVVRYGYDALGRRINRIANGNAKAFIYDDMNIVSDQSSGDTVNYLNGLYLDDKLRQSGENFEAFYYLQDHLGSTVALTTAAGGILEQIRYEPFGENTGSIRTRYGYTGRELDEATGLIYSRFRWYDPLQGRFMQEDPIGFYGGLNMYEYVSNNPISFNDPLGLIYSECLKNWTLGGAVVGGAAGAGAGAALGGGLGTLAGGLGTIPLGLWGGVKGGAFGAGLGAIGGGLIGTLLCGDNEQGIPNIPSDRCDTKPIVDPNIYTRGDKDKRKINKKRKEGLDKTLKDKKQKLSEENKKPNKTPEDKDNIDRLEREIKKLLDALKKSETHGRKGKGN